MHRSGMLKVGKIETRQECKTWNRSHRIEGRCATTSITQIYTGKAKQVASRRNTCNLEDHLGRSLAGKHTDTYSEIDVEDSWQMSKQSSTLEDDFGWTLFIINGN
eukprot:7632703-Heterocapsa_arctica.AAC.1